MGEDVAEDLTATTFEKAWRGRAQYQHEQSAVSTWLFTIARNVATDYLRGRRADVPLDDLREHSADDNPADAIELRDEFAQLSILLAQLPARERELIALKYGADLTNRAIATVMKLSESNVGTILHRTLAELRVQWDKTSQPQSRFAVK
jgi:RNA polymerase sigma-70 factor (ECF subfamily)